jgi:(E)-4-hydroxy-3-methylbut-2-enyl-diphosphate synthase
MRNIKTEYVSCPSCGRTLFDLQVVTEQIRTRTGHLPGERMIVFPALQAARASRLSQPTPTGFSHALTMATSTKTTCLVLSATGVSIAVMGCIVNGPGEMADADFGCDLAVAVHIIASICCHSFALAAEKVGATTSAGCVQVCGRRSRQD